MSSIVASSEINEWDDPNINLKTTLLRGIYSIGFEKPSPVQKKVIKPMTKIHENGKRRDIIAQAQSGTGKTGAFSVSALQIIDEKEKKTQVLILAPTHELARQIKGVIDSLSIYLKIKTQLLIGGTNIEESKKNLEQNTPQIVIGTPGRVHDMIKRKYLNTEFIDLLIVDEADEMLDTGFKEQMYKIFSYVNQNVQIGLFSATLPEELTPLINKFMRNPTKILVKSEMLTLQGIAQYYVKLNGDEHKYETLKDLFDFMAVSQAIIYCNSIRRVDDLYSAMIEDKFPVKKIHGKMSQSERKDNFKQFKNGGCRVLITSDLFARGIDVQQVSIVINFDVPKSEHTYLHRIGRSGRWGRKGIAINFLTKHDQNKIERIEKHYQTVIKEMPSNYTSHLGY